MRCIFYIVYISGLGLTERLPLISPGAGLLKVENKKNKKGNNKKILIGTNRLMGL